MVSVRFKDGYAREASRALRWLVYALLGIYGVSGLRLDCAEKRGASAAVGGSQPSQRRKKKRVIGKKGALHRAQGETRKTGPMSNEQLQILCDKMLEEDALSEKSWNALMSDINSSYESMWEPYYGACAQEEGYRRTHDEEVARVDQAFEKALIAAQLGMQGANAHIQQRNVDLCKRGACVGTPEYIRVLDLCFTERYAPILKEWRQANDTYKSKRRELLATKLRYLQAVFKEKDTLLWALWQHVDNIESYKKRPSHNSFAGNIQLCQKRSLNNSLVGNMGLLKKTALYHFKQKMFLIEHLFDLDCLKAEIDRDEHLMNGTSMTEAWARMLKDRCDLVEQCDYVRSMVMNEHIKLWCTSWGISVMWSLWPEYLRIIREQEIRWYGWRENEAKKIKNWKNSVREAVELQGDIEKCLRTKAIVGKFVKDVPLERGTFVSNRVNVLFQELNGDFNLAPIMLPDEQFNRYCSAHKVPRDGA